MPQPDDLSDILERIAKDEHTEADLKTLQDWLNQCDRPPSLLQAGKYSVNIQQALGPLQIGDRLELTEDNIQAIVQAIRTEISNSAPPQPTEVASVDELVQQVRSRIHNDIQRLHGTMPLWGVDHWVPLGELFVDLNILEEVSSNQRSELTDLWQDFSQNPSYRGLDRMGLNKARRRVSGLEVLDRDTNLMVVGKPGSGKTTYLQRVVTECNAGNLQAQRIPVLIRLREFVEDGREVGYSVERYLERLWRLSDQAVRPVLDEGQSLVLLDGLDEVTGADGQAIAKQIEQFARAYPQVQVIVTCRTQSQESRFARFDYVEVADFNEQQVRAFADHWFQSVCEDLTVGQTKAIAFLDQLFREENKLIQELAITPILLSLTCAVFQQTGKFYSKRSKLYEEGLELLLEQWDKSREIERDEIYRDLSVERKLELLSYLAVKKFEKKQYVLFEQKEIEEYIAEFLGIGQRESQGVLKALETQHGLLIERFRKIWSFSHLTFQEYFATKYIVNAPDPQTAFRNLAQHITKSRWQEIFLLAVEILEKPDDLLKSIKEQIDLLAKRNNNLNQFLVWVSQKSQSITSEYRPSSVRAFYFSLCQNDELFRHYFDLSLATAIDSKFDPILSEDDFIFVDLLGKKKFLNLSFDIAFDHDLVLLILIAIDATSDFNTTSDGGKYDQLLNFLLFFQSERDLPMTKYRENDFKLIYLNALMKHRGLQSQILRRYCDNEMEESLADLYSCLPDRFDQSTSYFSANSEWWGKNGQSWVEKLRQVLISCRRIGHDWEFSRAHRLELETYYNANKLLLRCLNINTTLDPNLKREIEEELLLPITISNP